MVAANQQQEKDELEFSLAAIMRAILYSKKVNHPELVLLRRKAIKAESVSMNGYRPVHSAAVAMVMYERLVEQDKTVASVLGLSNGKLVKLAIKWEQRNYDGYAEGNS